MPFVSLHGRVFGFDSETGAIVRNGREGASGDQTVSAASTTSNIAPRGITTINSTAAATYTLDAPIPGVIKVLQTSNSSTAARVVNLASGYMSSTAGATMAKATFNGTGQTLTLQGLSTALYAVLHNVGVTLAGT
jgi:hypothetical protein